MKKLFILIALVFICNLTIANTIELNQNSFSKISEQLTEEKDETVRICYLIKSISAEPIPGLIETTHSWFCVNHPEIPGSNTIYIGGPKP